MKLIKQLSTLQAILTLTIIPACFASAESDHTFDDQNYHAQQHDQHTCTISLMWINENANFDQKSIFPPELKRLQLQPIQYVFDWALKNPENTIIQVWYDGTLVSEEAVMNTQKEIDNFQESTDFSAPIILKDLRSIPFVQDNIHLLSTILPVYFRSDLLRLIVLFDEVTNQGTPYAVYGDLDMTPLTHKELFDEKTLFLLEKYGTVIAGLGKTPEISFENSFQILTPHNKYFLEALKTAMIDTFTEGARAFILMSQDNGINSNDDLGSAVTDGLGNAIFANYRFLFKYFAHLDGRGILSINSKGETENLDIQKHGLMTLIQSFTYGANFLYDPEYSKLKYTRGDVKLTPEDALCIPTKQVRVHATNHIPFSWIFLVPQCE